MFGNKNGSKCQEELAALRGQIREVASEVGGLVQAAVEGKLDTRGDPSKFEGELAQIVERDALSLLGIHLPKAPAHSEPDTAVIQAED